MAPRRLRPEELVKTARDAAVFVTGAFLLLHESFEAVPNRDLIAAGVSLMLFSGSAYALRRRSGSNGD